jgi:putative transposase
MRLTHQRKSPVRCSMNLIAMARLPRLAVAGLPHHVIQRGHNHQPVFLDDEDRQAYLAALREAAANLRVLVHGYVLMPDHVHLLLTPPQAADLSALMQAIGRRYVAGFNRRHARAGTLWDGRFRACVLEPESHLLEALRYLEQNPVRAGLVPVAADWPWSSAAHHLGRRRDLLLSEHALFWRLGNTPFEREAAWQRLLDEPLPAAVLHRHASSVSRSWPLGSGAFLADIAARAERPVEPRPRGRPRKLAMHPDGAKN